MEEVNNGVFHMPGIDRHGHTIHRVGGQAVTEPIRVILVQPPATMLQKVVGALVFAFTLWRVWEYGKGK
jgi:hypothetical protein